MTENIKMLDNLKSYQKKRLNKLN